MMINIRKVVCRGKIQKQDYRKKATDNSRAIMRGNPVKLSGYLLGVYRVR